MLWKFLTGLVISFFIAVPIVHAQEIFTKYLRYGSKGDVVIELQEFLTEEKLYAGPISGSFYSLTRAAVRKFQKREKLRITGVWDKKTRERANKILTAQMKEEEEEKPAVAEPVWPWLVPTPAPAKPGARAPSAPSVTPPATAPPTAGPSKAPSGLQRFLQPIVDWLLPTIPTVSTTPSARAESTPFVVSSTPITSTPAPTASSTPPQSSTCYDSDGYDLFKRGDYNYYDILAKDYKIGPEFCIGFFSNKYGTLVATGVKEMYCEEGVSKNDLVSCPAEHVCFDGACFLPPVTKTPPVITNTTVSPSIESPLVPDFSWKTNTLTVGELIFSGPSIYAGTRITALSLNHAVYLDLALGTYPYTITATDLSGNKASVKGELLILSSSAMQVSCSDNGFNTGNGSKFCNTTQCLAGCITDANGCPSACKLVCPNNEYNKDAGMTKTCNTAFCANGCTFDASSCPVGCKAPSLVVSDVTVSEITDRSARVKWKTNVPATSEVWYDVYGAPYPPSLKYVIEEMTTNHDVLLEGFKSSTTYYYTPISTDADGRRSPITSYRIFTTKALVCPNNGFNIGNGSSSCSSVTCAYGCEVDANGCPATCKSLCPGNAYTEGFANKCNTAICPDGCTTDPGNNYCPTGCKTVCPNNGFNTGNGSKSCSLVACQYGCETDNNGCPSGCTSLCPGNAYTEGYGNKCNTAICSGGCNVDSSNHYCPTGCKTAAGFWRRVARVFYRVLTLPARTLGL